MKKSLVHIALAGLFLLGWHAASASAQTLLNEINVNPPSTDNPCEYIEIRGAAGAALSNLYFVSFEGDGAATGAADFVVNLNGRTLGSDGLLVIVSPTACPGRTIPAGATQVTDAQLDTSTGGIENGTTSSLLISSSTAIVEGTDYDADNNGSLELLPSGATIADAIGWTDGDNGDTVYGGVFLSQITGTPNAATRFANYNVANSGSAWYNGVLDGTVGGNASTAYSTTAISPNFPTGGALTPGAANTGAFVPRKALVDYNGDGRTDFSTIRNQGGQTFWYNLLNGTNEVRGVQWGLAAEDVFVPADYDGDQRDDVAVWRASGFGDPDRSFFFIIQSGTNTVRIEQFGRDGDDPSVVGDYDGDLKADLAVFRGSGNSQAVWYYRPSATPSTDFTAVPWGLGLDFPAPGDYDGDGKNDFVVQRDLGAQAAFYILRSTGGNEVVQWGLGSDFIIPGDYDGDNRNDFCVSRPDSSGNLVFYVLTRTGAIQYYTWGIQGDELVAGDYNGDGKSDIAVWRPGVNNGASVFYVRPASSTTPDIIAQWGLGDDVPVANFQVQ